MLHISQEAFCVHFVIIYHIYSIIQCYVVIIYCASVSIPQLVHFTLDHPDKWLALIYIYILVD